MHLAFVGVGSGDPELITLKALNAIQQADIVFALRNQATGIAIALDIAEPYLKREAQTIRPIDIPRGRRAGERTDVWQRVADEILTVMQPYTANHQQETVRAVMLQLGDPTLYGTFNYITDQLVTRDVDIQTTVIPGVSSFLAAAAALQIPLSSVDERVAIFPATYGLDADKLRELLADFDTIVLMKVGFVRGRIIELLSLIEVEDGLNVLDQTVYVERLGLPNEQVITDVRQIDRTQKGEYLALMIVRQNSS